MQLLSNCPAMPANVELVLLGCSYLKQAWCKSKATNIASEVPPPDTPSLSRAAVCTTSCEHICFFYTVRKVICHVKTQVIGLEAFKTCACPFV